MNSPPSNGEVAPERVLSMIEAKSQEICDALDQVDPIGLGAASRLTGWTRLTLACHLRYGAQATRQVIEATLDGRPGAFYPGGRELQRPFTLRPALGESAAHVVESLGHEVAELHRTLIGLDDEAMASLIIEHPDNRDLGEMTIGDLVRMRLTEVQAHGDDLDLGLSPWPSDFGKAVIAQRAARLRQRPLNWAGWEVILVVTDASALSATVSAEGIELHARPVEVMAASRLVGTANAHVAMLLGRRVEADLTKEGDAEQAQACLASVIGP